MKKPVPTRPPVIAAVLLLLAILMTAAPASDGPKSAGAPKDFPQFVVPGFEAQMLSMREFFWLHYQPAGPLIPLWDAWMPMSTLWPALGSGPELENMRGRWAAALAGRLMDSEGYVACQQHDGPAHAGGWPFPSWVKAGGIGWHFRGTGVPGYEPPLTTPEGWQVLGGKAGEVDAQGWVLDLTEPKAVTRTPSFAVPAHNAPWLRLNWWADGLDRANCYVEWTTKEKNEFTPERRFYFSPATARARMMPKGENPIPGNPAPKETRTMIPVYRSTEWKGTITGLRIGFDNPGTARVVIKSFHTACDTRHTINNLNFIRGVHDYFTWSRDLALLRDQMARLRSALRFTMREFDTRKRSCIFTTWPGHEGRSGVRWTADGQKRILPGEGIGGNYWDLLPFGGEDALATIYYYDTLRDMAELEELVTVHPEWGVPGGADAFEPVDLRRHAEAVKEYGTREFWNPLTGRFGTVDLDGVLHDYGWTFLNNEAVYYEFATPAQARSIRDWISGRRIVPSDTSVGGDIYHWRFGPRATTRRNVDYYYWGWSNPETIPWGSQVQDGGAVLGFAYHDLMCRLKADGPDDAWRRLQEILAWFEQTQSAGGYRAYYAQDPARGTMQGGNVAGGLGLDKEFFESILVPQVMLYGFLGFEPTVAGFKIAPRLPKTWPELTITRVHLHDAVLDLTAKADGTIAVRSELPSELPLAIELPPGTWRTQPLKLPVESGRVTIRLAVGLTEFIPVH